MPHVSAPHINAAMQKPGPVVTPQRTVRQALATRAPAWAKISMARTAHVATSMGTVSVPEYGATAAT